MAELLYERRDFDQLLALVADERGLDPMLVEKDYLKARRRNGVNPFPRTHMVSWV